MDNSASTTSSSNYTCGFPGCPNPVSIHISLIETLQRIVRDTCGDQQGIIYGQPSPAGTIISSCREVKAFSVEEIRAAAAEATDLVVGFYRIREGTSLVLHADEIRLAETCFSRPGSVVLLVERRGQCPEANCFFFEHGQLLNFPLLQFPLESGTLMRREALRLQKSTSDTEIMPAQAEAQMSGPPPTLPSRAAYGEPPAVKVKRVSIGLVSVTIAFCLLMAYLSAALFINRRNYAASSTSRSMLSLQAERQGEDVRIVWDLTAPAVVGAASGVVEIEDGSTKRQIPLNGDQIRFGSLLYAYGSDQVSVRLTTLNKENQSTGYGSVLMLLKKPLPPEQPAARVPAPNVAALNVPAPNVAAPNVPAPNVPLAGKGESKSSPRVFLPPQTIKGDTTSSVELASPPVIAERLMRFDPPAPLSTESELVRVAEPALRSEPAKLPEAHSSPVYSAPVLVYQEGVLVPRELTPILVRPVSVNVRVEVNEFGRVIRAEAVAGQRVHALLLKAATEAARGCRFQPARRDQLPVSSTVVVVFHLGGDK